MSYLTPVYPYDNKLGFSFIPALQCNPTLGGGGPVWGDQFLYWLLAAL